MHEALDLLRVSRPSVSDTCAYGNCRSRRGTFRSSHLPLRTGTAPQVLLRPQRSSSSMGVPNAVHRCMHASRCHTASAANCRSWAAQVCAGFQLCQPRRQDDQRSQSAGVPFATAGEQKRALILTCCMLSHLVPNTPWLRCTQMVNKANIIERVFTTGRFACDSSARHSVPAPRQLRHRSHLRRSLSAGSGVPRHRQLQLSASHGHRTAKRAICNAAHLHLSGEQSRSHARSDHRRPRRRPTAFIWPQGLSLYGLAASACHQRCSL